MYFVKEPQKKNANAKWGKIRTWIHRGSVADSLRESMGD